MSGGSYGPVSVLSSCWRAGLAWQLCALQTKRLRGTGSSDALQHAQHPKLSPKL